MALDPVPTGAPTTLHVRRAREGTTESLDWLVERFTPLLLAQARQRLGPSLARRYEPEELVNDVWVVALRALPELAPRGERATPTFVAFLSKTLLLRVRELARHHALRSVDDGEPELQSDRTRGIVTRVATSEAVRELQDAIAALEPTDREVLVLRAIEQHPNHVAAELLGQTPNAVSLRYNRVLEKLRKQFPDSVLTELAN